MNQKFLNFFKKIKLKTIPKPGDFLKLSLKTGFKYYLVISLEESCELFRWCTITRIEKVRTLKSVIAKWHLFFQDSDKVGWIIMPECVSSFNIDKHTYEPAGICSDDLFEKALEFHYNTTFFPDK